MDRIVVGVDGSAGSKRALEWAVEEATLRNTSLDLVHVYTAPLPPEGLSSAAQAEAIMHGSRTAAESLLAGLAADIDAVPVTQVAIESASPAHALVDHSEGAVMLVLSARGLGPFRRLLLGSVSQQAALHARCPTLIIRPEES